MQFHKGERIFIPGAAGEPTSLVKSIFGAEEVDITTSFVPGLNPLEGGDIGAGSRVTGLFMQAGLSRAQRAGSFRHLPISYAAMLKHIATGPGFDACVLQVGPPDSRGRCSLGPAAEFSPAALAKARRIIAVINPNVPGMPNAPWISYDRIGTMIESDTALVSYDVGSVDDATRRIARNVANLIEDGATVQVGLGKVPHALMEMLHGHRGLKVHSGMISDGIMAMMQAGALDTNYPHSTTAILGTRALYEWVRERGDINVRGVAEIHAPQVLAGLDRFVAVNSALEVDLFGQCNLELASGRAVSGGGGASDFARGARLGPGGISVVALPATFGGGRESRICARLQQGGIATLPRGDVDIVATEEGIADLRGRSVHERAEAIIQVAAPEARKELTDQWEAIAARL